MYREYSDEVLLDLLKEGDNMAFETIFGKYYLGLLAHSKQYVEMEDGEEVVQDLMCWLWNNRENIYFNSSLQNYLFKAVRNRCLTLISKHKIKENTFSKLRVLAGYEETSSDFYVQKELQDNVYAAIERLPESYKEAFTMNRFQNMTYQEIAKELQVSPKTIDYRIQQALKILRKELKDYLPLIAIALPNLLDN